MSRAVEDARIHPEKAGEIAIKFKRYTGYGYTSEDHCHDDPLYIIRVWCKYDHYTAYTTALNIYAQYVADSLKNNSEIFYALSNFKKAYEYVLDGTIEQLISRSFNMVKIDAAKGDTLSQYTLASEYERLGRIGHRSIHSVEEYDGAVVRYDGEYYYDMNCRDKAAYWYLKAAEQGMSDAMLHLAKCYEEGFGVKKSKIKAKEWYEKAALAGNGYAMIRIGDIYQSEGTLERAKSWWTKARETGDCYQETEARLQKIYN